MNTNGTEVSFATDEQASADSARQSLVISQIISLGHSIKEHGPIQRLILATAIRGYMGSTQFSEAIDTLKKMAVIEETETGVLKWIGN